MVERLTTLQKVMVSAFFFLSSLRRSLINVFLITASTTLFLAQIMNLGSMHLCGSNAGKPHGLLQEHKKISFINHAKYCAPSVTKTGLIFQLSWKLPMGNIAKAV